MEPNSEHRLKEWLQNLKVKSLCIVDEITPFEYTLAGQMALGKDVSSRHIKMAIFGNVIQMSILYSLAYFIFPDKAVPIVIFSLYFGAAYTWYVIAKLRFKRKWDLVEGLEVEADEWRNDLKNNTEYLERISDIVNQHRKLLTMNNYHALKDVIINKNTDTSNGKHLFITKDSIDNDIFGAHQDVSHINMLSAMNKVALESILEYEKSSWTRNSPGSANIVMSPLSDEFMQIFEDYLSKTIESLKAIVETSPKHQNHKTENSEKDLASNVVNIFASNKDRGVDSKITPHQSAFIEVSRITGLIADIIEPLIDRFKLSAVDQTIERKLLLQAQEDIQSLNSDIENIHQKSKTLAGR